MSRMARPLGSAAFAFALGSLALAFATACSGDAEDGASQRAGGASGGGEVDLDGDGSAAGGSAGNSGAGSSSGATYTAAQACQRFAQTSCNKGVECGLVLAQTGSALICVQCDALSLAVIERACEQDSPGDKSAAEVDRCLANLSAQPCAEACVNPSGDGCEVFGELSSDQQGALVCDSRCTEPTRR